MSVTSLQRKLEISGDNYKQTVLALRAFANEILFDDSTHAPMEDGSVHCGRKFRTSASNRHSPTTNVTPDLAVVVEDAYAVIAEAKLGFDTDPVMFAARVDETIRQIEKYDDALTGWPHSSSDGAPALDHDLVVIINYEDSRRAARELKLRQENGSFSVTRPFSVISIVRSGRAAGEWPVLGMVMGSLSDARKTRKLEDLIPIREEILATSVHVGSVQLYDECPPMPLMMDLVHKAIVTNLTADEQEQYNIEGRVAKRVTVRQLCRWLSRYAFTKHDGRDPDIPKADWIRAAMLEFVAMNWAERDANSKARFTYHHIRGRKNYNNPYGRFVETIARKLRREQEKARKARERQQARKEMLREKAKKAAPLFAKQIDAELDPDE